MLNLTQSVYHPETKLDMGRNKGSKNVLLEKNNQIITICKAGLKQARIARYFNMSANNVKSILRRSKQMSINKSMIKMGRKPKFLPENHIHVLNYVQEHKTLPLYDTAAQYRAPTGQQISKYAIERCLHRNGIRIYIAAFKIFVSEKHVNARLHWCTLRQQWTTKQWKTVVFSDYHLSHCVLLRIIYVYGERLAYVTILTTLFLL